MNGTQDPNSIRAQLGDQVKVLADKFLQRTAVQILGFEAQLERLAAGDRSVLTSIAEVAHQIYGSGAVFGFTQLSECAGRLEERSAQMAGESAAAQTEEHAQWAKELTEQVERLSQALHQALRPATR